MGNGGRFKAGSTRSTAARLSLWTLRHQPHFAQGVDGAFEQHADILELAPFLRIRPRMAVGDELRVGLHHDIDDFQIVGAQRRTGLGDLHDGVRQHGGLYLGGAPTEFHLGLDAVRSQ